MKKVLFVSGHDINEKKMKSTNADFQGYSIKKAIEGIGYKFDSYNYMRYIVPKIPWELNIIFVYIRSLFLYFYVKKVKPDVLLVAKGNGILRKVIKKISDLGVYTINWTVDDVFGVHNPFNNVVNIAEYDLCISYDRYCAEELNRRGLRSKYVPLCYDPAIFYPKEKAVKEFDVSFVGSWDPKREEYLTELLDYDLHVWGKGWEHCKNIALRKKVHRESCYGAKMNEVLNKSKISINILHRQSIESVNYRFFEISASGTFCLCEYNPIIDEMIDVKSELIVFRSKAEMKERVHYFLNNPRQAREISLLSHKKLKKYTFTELINQIIPNDN